MSTNLDSLMYKQPQTTVSQDSYANRTIPKTIAFQEPHRLPMEKIYLQYIVDGVKSFEGRIFRATVTKMKANDQISFFDKTKNCGVYCKIISIDTYNSYENMLKAKGVIALLPQLTEEAKNCSADQLVEKGVAVYKSFPNSKFVTRYGVAAIGISFLEKFQL